MPVYNTENYLSEAIESVLNQTYKKLELVLVEDRSTDASLIICEKYARLDKRIKLVRGEHKGVSYARNKGIENATGELITFVDSDDFIHPETYEIVFSREDDGTAIYAFGIQKFYDNEMKPEFFTKEEAKESTDAESVISINSFKECIDAMCDDETGIGFYLWNKIYPADLVKKLMIDTDYTMCEDLIFNWRAMKQENKIYITKIPMYYYRHTNGSLTRTPSLSRYLDCVKAYSYILADEKQKDISETAHKGQVQSYIGFNLILLEIMCLTCKFDKIVYNNAVNNIKQYKSDITGGSFIQTIKTAAAIRSFRLFHILFSIEKAIRVLLKKKAWYVS